MMISENNASPLLSSGRIPSLDGLRAISIGLVILAHLCGTQGFWLGEDFFRPVRIGNFGVRVFFVISGFLITTLLLEERSKTGKISLKNFYIRRALRIFPACYTFIALIGLAGIVGILHVKPIEFIAACTYTINFTRLDMNMGHLWSLAVEEQFYIIWPFVLSLFGKRRAVLAAGIMFMLGPCARFGYTWWGNESIWIISTSFLANADALASGCLLSALWGRLGTWNIYARFNQSWWFLIIPLLVCLCSYYWRLRNSPLGVALLNICIALCIDWCVRNYTSIIGRVLNWRPITFIGVLSYSLYLWQQPFINRYAFHGVNMFPYNLGCAIVCALLSYYLIERQFLKLRKRLSFQA